MQNVMIDLETVDTRPTAAILSIGAVKFDRTGILADFYCPIDVKTCLKKGMTQSGETMEWWQKQSEDARKVLTEGNTHIATALMIFKRWLGERHESVIWGNGAAVDNVILSNAYHVCGIEQPWKFRNDRCYRTIAALSGTQRTQIGTHHNALDDARSQALHLIEIEPDIL